MTQYNKNTYFSFISTIYDLPGQSHVARIFSLRGQNISQRGHASFRLVIRSSSDPVPAKMTPIRSGSGSVRIFDLVAH